MFQSTRQKALFDKLLDGEFIRGMYQCKGSYSRTRNFWGFKRKIPLSFYEGTTGVEPIDNTIKTIPKQVIVIILKD